MNNDREEFNVGYGKPPKHSRFQPGQSGNPAGRPKKIKGLKELLAEELQEVIRVDGKKIRLQKAVVQSLIRNAIKGKPAAMTIVFRYLEGLDPEITEELFEPEVEDQNILRNWLFRQNAARKEDPND